MSYGFMGREDDCGDGYTNDAQRAFAVSRMFRQPDDTAKIDELVRCGQFVVVVYTPEYCPATDAVMGSRAHLESSHATRDEATEACRKLWEADDELDARVLPYEAEAQIETFKPSYENDMPF